MPVVCVIPVDPERGDFHTLTVHPDCDSAMLDPCIDRSSKGVPHLLRRCAGRDIPVIRNHTDHAVAHAASDHICLIATLMQPVQHFARRPGYIDLLSAVCHLSSLSCISNSF